MFKIFIMTMFSVLISGCATVFTGTNQAVNVTAIDEDTKQDLEDVNCTITDTDGVMYQLTSNPGAIVIPKGNAPLQVKCHQEGYEPFTGVITDSFATIALLDIFLWPTFFVDIATGAIKKYPGQYSVVMDPEAS